MPPHVARGVERRIQPILGRLALSTYHQRISHTQSAHVMRLGVCAISTNARLRWQPCSAMSTPSAVGGDGAVALASTARFSPDAPRMPAHWNISDLNFRFAAAVGRVMHKIHQSRR